jgi:hypothetical protein
MVTMWHTSLTDTQIMNNLHTQKKSINNIISLFLKPQNQQNYTIYLHLLINIYE